jgi:translation elongation factor P/translation initiation factor 5A
MKEGDLLEIDGGLWRVMSKAISRTAQGRAYVQTELRHLTGEVKKAIRLRSEDSVERVALSSRTKYHWQVLRVCVVSDAVLAMPVHEKSVE